MADVIPLHPTTTPGTAPDITQIPAEALVQHPKSAFKFKTWREMIKYLQEGNERVIEAEARHRMELFGFDNPASKPQSDWIDLPLVKREGMCEGVYIRRQLDSNRQEVFTTPEGFLVRGPEFSPLLSDQKYAKDWEPCGNGWWRSRRQIGWVDLRTKIMVMVVGPKSTESLYMAGPSLGDLAKSLPVKISEAKETASRIADFAKWTAIVGGVALLAGMYLDVRRVAKKV